MNVDEAVILIKSRKLDYWQEAEIFKSILQEGITQEDLARMVGLKQSTISNKMRVLKLSAEVQNMIKSNGLSERYARALLKIRGSYQQLQIINHIIKNCLNVWATDDYIARFINASQDSRDIKGFTSIIKQGMLTLKAKGINVSSKKVEREDSIDLIIRIPK